MDWVIRISIGTAMAFVGFQFVRKSSWLVYNVGRVPFAEKYLGSSHTFYKILGVIAIFFGFLVMTNLMGGFIMGTIGRLFGNI